MLSLAVITSETGNALPGFAIDLVVPQCSLPPSQDWMTSLWLLHSDPISFQNFCLSFHHCRVALNKPRTKRFKDKFSNQKFLVLDYKIYWSVVSTDHNYGNGDLLLSIFRQILSRYWSDIYRISSKTRPWWNGIFLGPKPGRENPEDILITMIMKVYWKGQI